MLLNRSTLELAKLASKKESRFTLQAICVTEKEAVVTDGHIMVITSHPSTNALEESFPVTDGLTHRKVTGDTDVLVSRDAALAALKALPKRTKIPILSNAAIGTDSRLYVNQLDSVQSFKHEVDGRFPNWKQVIPNGEPVAEICVNAKLMKQLCDYFIAVGDARTPCIRLTVYNKTGAMRIDGNTVDFQNITALLIPLRSDGHYAERPDETRVREAAELAERVKAETEAADADMVPESEVIES